MKELLEQLIGEWRGEGNGQYPTIPSFHYLESLSFTAAGEGLHYHQITRRLVGPEQYKPSHQESGFLRLLEDNKVEIANVQVGGRVEILRGPIEARPGGWFIQLKSIHLANDSRMVESTRTISLQGDSLLYTMHMQTTRVPRLALHLEATLRRNGSPLAP